jgi:transcriptional regulator with XRE-family HTH domain
MKKDADSSVEKKKHSRKDSVPHPISKAFGQYIKSLRIGINKSQSELAFDASIDRTYISLIERGHSSATLLVLLELSKALNQSTAELVAGFELALKEQKLNKKSIPRRAVKSAVNKTTIKVAGTRRSPLR